VNAEQKHRCEAMTAGRRYTRSLDGTTCFSIASARDGPVTAQGSRQDPRGEPASASGELAIALDAVTETATLSSPIFALIVYRLGQEILNLQSGVRFPVGALY
jgi:hypothetical protein